MKAPRLPMFILVALLALVPSSRATWSIVLTDMATGEVAVGTATCLEGFVIENWVPVIVVGKGAGVAHGSLDTSGQNRILIRDQLLLGTSPPEIIQLVIDGDLLKCSRLYGIADLQGGRASFAGGCVTEYKMKLRGNVGSVAYAIQGGAMTGEPVGQAALDVILTTDGEALADRLMAAMAAAASMGGDGRCSCLTGSPQSCGSPPPSFDKSAHCGTVIVARVGDTDGNCSGGGCATGDYWMNLRYSGFVEDVDPMVVLESQYEAFKDRMRGHVDGLKSEAVWTTSEPRSGGGGVAQLDLALADFEGTPLTHGGAKITISHAEGSAGLSERQVITDHGDGTYTIRFLATAATGTDRFEISLVDGGRPATLYPLPEIDYPVPLQASTDEISSSAGGKVVFDLQGPAEAAGDSFVLGLSLDGPDIGFPLPSGLMLPLRADRLLAAIPQLVSAGLLKGVPGRLDAQGRATVAFEVPPGLLDPFVGQTLRAAWCTYHPATFASGAVTLHVTR